MHEFRVFSFPLSANMNLTHVRPPGAHAVSLPLLFFHLIRRRYTSAAMDVRMHRVSQETDTGHGRGEGRKKEGGSKK